MTNITVYAIALGGKFIGTGQEGVAKLTVTTPDGTAIVKDVPINQNPTLMPLDGDGSGDVAGIMGQSYKWGVPIDKTDAFLYNFQYKPLMPVQLTFTVRVYHSGALRATASNQQMVWDGLDLTGPSSVVVVLPGLLTNVVTTSPMVFYSGIENLIAANVYMMCGCKIDNKYWPGANFNAQIFIYKPNHEFVQAAELNWSELATFSGYFLPKIKGDLVMRSCVLEKTNGNTAISDPVSIKVE